MKEQNRLYTLVIDYDGGTYVTQAKATGFEDAPSQCIRAWSIEGLEKEITQDTKLEILNRLKDSEFVELTGLKNVWCNSLTLARGLMLMNLICTCER